LALLFSLFRREIELTRLLDEGLQLRDGIHGGARLFARRFSFRTGGMQDATMFSAKTMIFRAIILV
jgi:hypothetical protein